MPQNAMLLILTEKMFLRIDYQFIYFYQILSEISLAEK